MKTRTSFSSVVENEIILKETAYRNTLFKSCRFSGCDWRGMEFSDCCFSDCLLEFIQMEGSRLHNVLFRGCKITGGEFFKCHSMFLQLRIEDSRLIACNFSGQSMVKGTFTGSQFDGCFFNGCNLRESDFSNSSFPESEFSGCDLRKADFASARKYQIDPAANRVKGTRFSFPEAMGLLQGFGIKIV